jgi:hypothetical protein
VRRVLIVSYFCPPQPEAAAVRIANLAQHLVEFGWEPVLVTRRYPGTEKLPFRVIQVGGPRDSSHESRPPLVTKPAAVRWPKLFRFIAGFVRGLVYFPDVTVGWLWPAIKCSLDLTRDERFDAILTTHGPATEHVIGFVVARLRHLPWVADFRDLWTGNPFVHWGPIHSALASWLELLVIRKADAVTAASGLASDLSRIHRREVSEIPNGFDRSIWEKVPSDEPASFQFCYAGRTYGDVLSPEVLFRSLATLRAEGDPAGLAAHLVFFGPDTESITALAARYGLAASVAVRGNVDRLTVLRAERQSAVLLIIIGWGRGMAGLLGSKIMEYVGAERPILALGPADSAVGAVLQETGLGRLASTESECVQAVQEAYERFKRKQFKPEIAATWKPWTGTDLAARFAETLNAVCGSVK